jgi:hypothetical protein
MGGPGTGKTSLMEVLCGDLARTHLVPIILVPAKKLDPRRPLLPEVQDYLRNNGAGTVADLITSTEDCVLAIDGFDELAYATLSTLDMFFRGAQDLVRERAGVRLKIVLSGRPTLFAVNDVTIPAGSHVVALQPFDKERVERWSTKWRNATGGTFDGTMYLKSPSSDVRELAAQPMLLYLLAKMHEDGEPIPQDTSISGGVRFEIYRQILNWVCRRQEGKQVSSLLSARLRRYLQIAGLATHQSGQRSLHRRHFARALGQAGLIEDATDVDAKVHSTILAFAFTSVEDSAWEFTHKSFGEALAAEAIGRVLEDISEAGRDGDPWRMPLPIATKSWVETFGPHFLTKDVLDFCRGWLYTKGRRFGTLLMDRLIEVLNQLLGRSVADTVATVAIQSERPVQMILGNAVRSWFAIANMNLTDLSDASGSLVAEKWLNAIDPEHYRTGVYLSSLVSPISPGEATALFAFTSFLFPGRRETASMKFMDDLVDVFRWLSSTRRLGESGRDHPVSGPIARRYRELIGLIYNRRQRYEWDLFRQSSSGAVWQEFLTPHFENLTPLESVFSELEDTIQHGYELHPYETLIHHTHLDQRGLESQENEERVLQALDRLVSRIDPSVINRYAFLKAVGRAALFEETIERNVLGHRTSTVPKAEVEGPPVNDEGIYWGST